MENLKNSKNLHPSICIIGAGFSGVCAGIQLQKKLNISCFTIYESNADFGGTWCANVYPGAACDVQSHLYSFSFEKNPAWSENYAPQKEIQGYLKKLARKYDLDQKVRFNTDVQSTVWDQNGCQWVVKVYDKTTKKTQEINFDFVISCMGAFRTPDIPEFTLKFQNPTMHSAQWLNDIDLNGKSVGIIGCGASAVQIIPEVAKVAKELHCFQRKPPYLIPKFRFNFPQSVQRIFTILPFFMILIRWINYLFNEFLFRAYKSDSVINFLGHWVTLGFLRAQVPWNKEVRDKLTPPYRLGCKQVLVSNDYFSTFNRPNVQLHRGAIEYVTEDSIKTANNLKPIKLDVLILATGFKVQEMYNPLKIYGIDGIDVQEIWRTNPSHYYGIMHNKLPNWFFVLGPNTGLAHTSIVFMIESQMLYISKVLQKFITDKARIVQVSEVAMDKFMTKLDKSLKKTVFGLEKGCGSWYANDEGKVTALWPNHSFYYYYKTQNVNFNDVEFHYN